MIPGAIDRVRTVALQLIGLRKNPGELGMSEEAHRLAEDLLQECRRALKPHAAYPELCFSPELCAGTGRCPKEICCND